MKTVAQMTLDEFRERVRAEAVLAAADLNAIVSGMPPDTEENRGKVAILLTMLAKERVWRKDLDARLTTLETMAGVVPR